MKKFALTSMVAILAVTPSFAVPTNTSATFPQNGYMLEDYTYTNAATSTNMAGVYENSVNADANYGDCLAGYWCDASGQHACSTAGDGSYTSSATGSTVNTQCYKACTVATANIAHASAVTGNDYYGAGTDTCSATACDAGYHQSNDWNTIVGTDDAHEMGYFTQAGAVGGSTYTPLYASGPMAFEIYYGRDRGYITGHARCSTQSGTPPYQASTPADITTTNNLTDETGQNGANYCWCQIDGYVSPWGTTQSLLSSWTYVDNLFSSTSCSASCHIECLRRLGGKNCQSSDNTSCYIVRSAILETITGGNATCDANQFYVGLGYYLPAASETVTSCPTGSFCPGVTGPVYYNATNAQGATACSTVGDGSYTNSDARATANTDCYKACTTASVAHSATVTGNDYYGAGIDNCSATTCENGYHLVNSNTADLTTLIGLEDASYDASTDNTGTTTQGTPSNYGIGNEPMAFAVDYSDSGRGYITGHGRCSTLIGTYDDVADEFTEFVALPDETGQRDAMYCYCQIDGYTPSSGNTQSLLSHWVFFDASDHAWSDAEDCTESCTQSCSYALSVTKGEMVSFRAQIFNSISSSATCEANTINIVWSGASAADIAANEAGTVTYGGDIRTPRAATIIPGKVFTGWTFSAPEPLDQ